MAELANIEQTVKKIPTWGWVAIVGGIGVVLYLQNRSGGSTPAAAASSTDTTGSQNTGTPSGQCNPSPEVPVCPLGDSIVWQTDQNGCPIPLCQPTTNNAANHYVTTDGHSTTFYTASKVYKEWGEATIKYYALIHNEGPNGLAAYGYDQVLPAGLTLKVGGSFP